MKTVGLITEYNPFHNGHKYHIEEAKRVTGADFVVVVMSGNFVQRGCPAMIDKYARTKMALLCGADLVFELPVCYATASAEYFALGAVALLDRLGFVDCLCFGSESGEINELSSIADLLVHHSNELDRLIQKNLKAGATYPAARLKAIIDWINNTSLPISNKIDYEAVLNEPNNILGIEYLKALLMLSSKIKPYTIKRKASDYHDLSLPTDNNLPSASAIRDNLKTYQISQADYKLDDILQHVPSCVHDLLASSYKKTYPIQEDDLSLLLSYRLLYETKKTLEEIYDCTPDLADRLLNQRLKAMPFEALVQALKSKNYTHTRICRVLLHILLQIKKEDILSYQKDGYILYARLLGIKKDSSFLLKEGNDNLTIINKLPATVKQLSEAGKKMLETDLRAAHLYNQLVYYKYGSRLVDEFRKGIIIL